LFVVIKGAGDIASGIALRLRHAGFTIAMTETAAPLAVRRTVAFSQAVYEGRARVEDVTAVLARNGEEMEAAFAQGHIAVFVDPAAEIVRRFRPKALVDAIMAKKNTGTSITDAPVVVGAGPGFSAGADCHAVVETKRGHTLGRVITTGSALPNTGIPGDIGGYTVERLLRSGADGFFEALAAIGSRVKKGETVARIRRVTAPAGKGESRSAAEGGESRDAAEAVAGSGAAVEGGGDFVLVCAGLDGIVRGLLPSGIAVTKGLKVGDIDPRCEESHCFTVSDKALAVGGGVLEAILRFSPGLFETRPAT
jgi:xanthine dehydrogenase accessory factor